MRSSHYTWPNGRPGSGPFWPGLFWPDLFVGPGGAAHRATLEAQARHHPYAGQAGPIARQARQAGSPPRRSSSSRCGLVAADWQRRREGGSTRGWRAGAGMSHEEAARKEEGRTAGVAETRRRQRDERERAESWRGAAVERRERGGGVAVSRRGGGGGGPVVLRGGVATRRRGPRSE